MVCSCKLQISPDSCSADATPQTIITTLYTFEDVVLRCEYDFYTKYFLT
jgi:hypothetical protein